MFWIMISYCAYTCSTIPSVQKEDSLCVEASREEYVVKRDARRRVLVGESFFLKNGERVFF